MTESTESRVVVNAEPAAVLDVIADFESYPEWTGAVRKAEIVETDDAGRASQVAFTLDAGAIKDSYTLGYTWDFDDDGAGMLSWDLVEASMLKAMDGAYVLRAVDEGTEVTYRLSVDVKMPMLGMLRRKAERMIIDTALSELKKRVEA